MVVSRPGRFTPGIHSEGDWLRRCGRYGEEKNFLPLSGIEQQLLIGLACILFAIPAPYFSYFAVVYLVSMLAFSFYIFECFGAVLLFPLCIVAQINEF
jgi:hypothetical protein